MLVFSAISGFGMHALKKAVGIQGFGFYEKQY
jgi:hypothetical protein